MTKNSSELHNVGSRFAFFVSAIIAFVIFTPYNVLHLVFSSIESCCSSEKIRWWTRLRRYLGYNWTFYTLSLNPFIKLRVIGPTDWHVRGDRKGIICSNHHSFWDIPALCSVIRGHDYAFVAKDSLKWIPIVGGVVAFPRPVWVFFNHDDKVTNKEQVKKSMKTELDKGNGLVVFPEGRRQRVGASSLLPFKIGLFDLALSTRVPIHPVVIQYKLPDPAKDPWYLLYKIDVITSDPVHVDGSHPFKDAHTLKDHVRLIMEQMYASEQ